ncbi:hypothetical protein BJ085DRAFT_14234 [Dimargaris cristalligena]|uniref:enoyl-[acyl-carrier-protein] reductase n=1 Tax=Dimargaris cristalligena TaxID=215637 RepID=A0A4P9ZU33_9FUNG|nr:hypothetical protein BJ085DRAFT_14234 [Dimargaris cristalligena]|eukprot:RKP36090.1 hypothetical protein BJ085DRAFT_14234 [Dimargaris cristalligena]
MASPSRFFTQKVDPSLLATNQAVAFRDYGRPADVLRLVNRPIQNFGDDKILVRILAAPINPADINQIEGVYPAKPPFEPEIGAVAGNEGVAEIVAIGRNIQGQGNHQVGNLVLPLYRSFGTWQSYAAVGPNDIYSFAPRKKVPILGVASMAINPSTAYRMLNDFVSLMPGDYVIQSGATSAVGQAVIQLCKIWGYKTINIIRDRPDLDTTINHLKSLGADVILTAEQMGTADTRQYLKALGSPIKLGLDCTAGKVASEIARALGPGAPLVIYGGMSRKPLLFPVSLFIFKDIQVRGFWMNRWYQHCPHLERQTMWEDLMHYMEKGELQPPKFNTIPWVTSTPTSSSASSSSTSSLSGTDGEGLLKAIRTAINGPDGGAPGTPKKNILIMDSDYIN